jgi:hypothetical protein
MDKITLQASLNDIPHSITKITTGKFCCKNVFVIIKAEREKN